MQHTRFKFDYETNFDTPVATIAQDKVERPVEFNISYGGPQAMLGWVGCTVLQEQE